MTASLTNAWPPLTDADLDEITARWPQFNWLRWYDNLARDARTRPVVFEDKIPSPANPADATDSIVICRSGSVTRVKTVWREVEDPTGEA